MSTLDTVGKFAGYAPRDPAGAAAEAPVALGDTVRFKPGAYQSSVRGFGEALNVRVDGTVIQIHAAHRWYRVAWEISPGCTGYETFKF